MADTNLNDFIINKLTQAQYDAAEKDPNQLYIVTDADKYQEKLTAGHNITINKNIISATDELPDQTGNIGKVLTTDGEKVGWVNPRIHNIFDYKWADHKLYDIRWLRADPYSWQWKSAYEAAYNHLVNDGSTQNATFTLASDGTFKILAGSTICIPAGFEADGLTRKYTTVTIDTDTTITEHSDTDGWTGYLWYVPSNNTFSIGSGMFLPTTEIPTTSSGVYWNEITNKAERYENGAYQEDWSFPIMRMTSSSTQITGILETYNGVNGFTKSTFTQNNITITYYTATEDKHTICLPDQETNLESLFQATGKAWFYILDTQNKRFKLPRDTNTEDSINNYLYFYVGDYTEDALKQAAGITAELLNDKVDIAGTQTITGTKTFTSPVHLQGNPTLTLDGKTLQSWIIAAQHPTSANGYTWYRKYSDGWVEQGGKFSTPQSTNDTHANINITLPVTMANNLYDFYAGGMVIIENGGTGGGWAGFYKDINSTATTLIILGWRTQTVSGNSFSWEVKGMAAQ